MDVELQVIADCPNTPEAFDLLRQALDHLGLSDVRIGVTTVTDAEHADRIRFLGSPAFVVDGRDLFENAGSVAAYACRVYPGPAGLTGLPTLAELTEALRRVESTKLGIRPM